MRTQTLIRDGGEMVSVVQPVDESAVDPDVLAYNHAHFGRAHRDTDSPGGSEVGEAAPGFTATTRLEDLYASPPPWDIGRPQPAFLALAEDGAIRSRVLDVGCGTGEHALMAADLGLDATGVDLAANALDTAEDKARERGLTARFLRHDARRLADLGESFNTVLDCGLFHIFDGEDRAAYVDSLRSVVASGGRYFMLGFSDRQPPGEWDGHGRRVHRLTRKEILAAFARGWRIDSIEPTTIDITTDPDGIRAWLVTLTRI